MPVPERPSLEERFGTRWVVWVGGLALALGGLFMVRYSIEQGWIGPGVRIVLGALLAAALIGTGEWLRRSEGRSDIAGISAANIPSILTAAGTTVAYATVWAAYALYGFLGPPAAFTLLGVVALVTLGAALLHGPALAALGLVGAEITPLLVAADKPDYWALYIYLAIVTAAAFAMANLRRWRWLAITALAFGLFWAFPGIDAAGALAPHLFHVVTGFALVALLIVAGLFYGPAAAPGRIDPVSSGAIIVYLAAACAVAVGPGPRFRRDHRVCRADGRDRRDRLAQRRRRRRGAGRRCAGGAGHHRLGGRSGNVASGCFRPRQRPGTGAVAGQHCLAFRARHVVCDPVRGFRIPRPRPA